MRKNWTKKLLDEIDQISATTPNGKPNSWACDLYTTLTNNNRLHERSGFSDFDSLMRQGLSNSVIVMGYDFTPADLDVTQCWSEYIQNWNEPRDTHHPNNIMTGVYYLKHRPTVPEILFYSPFADTLIRPNVYVDNRFNTTIASLHPEPGDLIYFDSGLKHSVPTNEVKGEAH